MDDGPIREEKTLFEKIRDKFSGGRRKKILITTCSPYTKNDRVIGTYAAKDEEQLKENMWKLREAIIKTGMTANEMREKILEYNKIVSPNDIEFYRNQKWQKIRDEINNGKIVNKK